MTQTLPMATQAANTLSPPLMSTEGVEGVVPTKNGSCSYEVPTPDSPTKLEDVELLEKENVGQ